MIKVYFDWNVMSQMKNGNHVELFDIVNDNESLFIPFSTSHIGDIFSSFENTKTQLDYINSDLEFISQLTKNQCFYNIKDKTALNYYDPKELFKQRIDEKDLFKNFNLESLEKLLCADELTRNLGKEIIDQIKSTPLDKSLVESLENEEHTAEIEKMLPGLRENPTMEGLFNILSNIISGLNEREDYKNLRIQIQSFLGINRNNIFNSENPYKIIEDKYQKIGIDTKQHFSKDKNSPKWFNEITNEYISLDMHGYQEDRVNVKKGRKETFKNTIEDSFHAAFATTCNFYVINDNKSYHKCKKTYKKLGIKTKILKPNEFVQHYYKHLNKSNYSSELNKVVEIMSSKNYTEEKTENGIFRTYTFSYQIFDFFDKIIILFSSQEENEKPTILLSQQSSKYHKLYSFELEKLIKILTQQYGSDINDYGEFNIKELKSEKWVGRKWHCNNIILRLTKLNGHFQLYLDI